MWYACGEVELPLLLEHEAERLPAQALHQVVGQPQVVRRDARRDDLDDVRVVEPREGARLVLDPSREVFARTELRMQRLQDVALADRRVFDVVDRAHPAGADEAQDLVDGAGNLLAGLVVARAHGGWPRCGTVALPRAPTEEPLAEVRRSLTSRASTGAR